MKKKKVLVLITKSNWGGAQRYVFDIAKNLPVDKFDIEVITGDNGPLVDKLKSINISTNSNLGIGRNINIIDDIKAFFNLIKIIKKIKPDILHLNSSKIGGLGSLAGMITGVPKIIFTIHGWAFNEDRTLFSKIAIKSIYWITIILSHVSIAVSDSVKHQIRNWPFVFKKLTVIHNSINPEALFSKTNARNELGKIYKKLGDAFSRTNPQKTLVLGTVAELHHIKGYDYVLQGVSEVIRLKKESNPDLNIIYVIIGEGEERKRIEDRIIDLGIQENVFLLGYIRDAYQYLKAFDIFLLGSLSEALAYVILEAGLAGLPVIATAVGGIPEIIDDMDSGILIQSKKPKEIQHAIEFYLTHKKTQKEYGLNLQKKVLENFSIKKMLDETMKVYESRLR